MVNGKEDGTAEATHKGDSNGTAEAVAEGKADGMMEGTTDGIAETISEGLFDGAANAVTVGAVDGALECVLLEGNVDVMTKGATGGNAETVAEGQLMAFRRAKKTVQQRWLQKVKTKALSMVKRMALQRPFSKVIMMVQWKQSWKEQQMAYQREQLRA